MKRYTKPLLRLAILVLVTIGIAHGWKQSMSELRRQEESQKKLLLDLTNQRESAASDEERALLDQKISEARRQSKGMWDWHPGWLAASLLLTLLGLSMSGGYWKVVVGKLGYPISLWKVEEAYFLGHLAKYVPGKALVLVVRSSKLADQRVPIATGIVSIFVETLIMMAVGATLGALGLFAKGGSTELVLLSLGMAVAATLPTAPPMFRLGLRWLATRKRVRFDFAFLERIDWKLIGSGWCLAGCGWLLQTIALWCLLRGMVSSDLVTDWYGASLWNACLIAATLPVVAGFVSFMPAEQGFGSMS